MSDHLKAFDKVKIQLLVRRELIFLSTVFFNLVHKWDELLPTAATNGKYIKFNPTFFMSLTAEEQLFLCLHETLHVALMHMLRVGERIPGLWNMAADYVINIYLVDLGFTMPKMGLLDERFRGMSVEEVYNILLDEMPEIPPECMDIMQPEHDNKEIKEEIDNILVRAKMQCTTGNAVIGSLPNELEVYLHNLENPKLPWNKILRRYLTRYSKTDYSYQKPNRRFFPQYILPSLYGKALLKAAFFFDASGSVDDKQFSTFVGETAGMLKFMKPNEIWLGEFDTSIKRVETIKSLQELRNMKFHGRGGTRIEPVLQWAIDHKPELLLIFTDGCFHFHDEDLKPKCDVIWLIHNNETFEAPFGKVIHYHINTNGYNAYP